MSARVIPPLAAISPGVAVSDDEDASPLDALFTLEDSHLTSSTLPETAPAGWDSATAYALGNEASIAVSGNGFDVYESLQSANTNHAPASLAPWWKLLGRTYGEYSGATSYALGDKVIVAADHLEYESLIGSNVGNDLDSETHWRLTGPTNRWRAFDVLRNTKASGPTGTTFVITPGKRVDAIGLAGIVADSFTITLKVAGITKWTYTESLSTRNTLSWSDYFFGSFTFRTVSAIFNIPKYSGAAFTITFTRASGDVDVGAIWINESVYLGELETEPQLGRRNHSTVDTTPQGASILIQRRTIPEHSWRLNAAKPYLGKIAGLIDLLNAVPAMWSGLEDTDDEYFEPTLLVAVYTRFDIIPGHPQARIDLGLRET